VGPAAWPAQRPAPGVSIETAIRAPHSTLSRGREGAVGAPGHIALPLTRGRDARPAL